MAPTKPSELFKNQDSASQFIFCKADCILFEKDKEEEKIGCVEPLKEAFPNILFGDDLIRYFIGNFLSEKFSVIAVKIDYDKKVENDYICLDSAKTIDKICKDIKGVWGLIDRAVLGILFENTDTPAQEYENTETQRSGKAEVIAEHIKKSLRETINENFFIGIASFPSIDYKKEDIIENAVKAIDHAILSAEEIASFNSVTLNISGDKYYERHDIKKAVSELEDALKLDPFDLNVLNSLGVCYGIKGDYLKALTLFEKIKEEAKEHKMAIYNIGVAHLMLNKKDTAFRYFLDLYNRNGQYRFEAGFQIAKIYIENKDHKKAEPYIDKIIELKPESAVCHRLAGDCYIGLGDHHKAISAYKRALKYNPYDAASISALGYLFDKCGENIEIAISFCKQSVINSPENGLYRYRLGKLYLKNNMIRDALSEFAAASKAGYDSSEYIGIIKKELNLL